MQTFVKNGKGGGYEEEAIDEEEEIDMSEGEKKIEIERKGESVKEKGLKGLKEEETANKKTTCNEIKREQYGC